ncbi:MAG: hypothetical protein JW904_00850 [Spirochaetales bacterium]|nr:hypothetical protein [Spirochaetales bacterium]
MAYKEFDITGGESVFCINEMQLRHAKALMQNSHDSAEKIDTCFRQIEADLSRNEQAALAFLIIEKLLG